MANRKDFVVKGGIVVNESTTIAAKDDGTIEFKDRNTNEKKMIEIAEMMISDAQGRTKKFAIDHSSGRLKTFDYDRNADTSVADKISLAANTTSDLAEGTNKYYTDARVASYLSSNNYVTASDVSSTLTSYVTSSSLSSTLANYATQGYVNTAVANVIDASPDALNTLNELAAALNDDPNFAATTATAIGSKIEYRTDPGTPGESAYLLSIGKHADGYQFIQSHGSQVLKLNPVGNNVEVGSHLSTSGNITTGGNIRINNVGGDRKIQFERTGGKVISIEHDASQIYFYNVTDSQTMLTIGNNRVLTAYGTITTPADIHVNYGNSNNSYLYLNKSSSGDGGILFRTANVNKWQNVQGADSINWYSYGASSVVMKLTTGGDLDLPGSALLGRDLGDVFTLNGKTQPHYGFNLDPSGSTPIGISGFYGISFATQGYERLKIERDGDIWISDNNLYIKRTDATDARLGIVGPNGGYQRVDGRDEGVYSRAHWYGVTNTGGTSNFRHAWYDGNSYVNVTAENDGVSIGGKLTLLGASISGFDGTDGLAIGGANPAISFASSASGRKQWLLYNTSNGPTPGGALRVYEADGNIDVWQIGADAGTNQHTMIFGGATSTWAAADRATFALGGSQNTSLLEFRNNNTNRGYIYSTGSTIEHYSYGEIDFIPNANVNARVRLNSNGLSASSLIAGQANASGSNLAALRVTANGTTDQGAAIAIQQETSEGDTIIFADYEPHVEWGISTENNSNNIDFTAGSEDGSIGVTKTFRNRSGQLRGAHVKVRINLTNGQTYFGNTLNISSSEFDGRALRIKGNGNIIQFEDVGGTNIWEIVGRDSGTYPFYIYKNTGTGSGYKFTIDSLGNGGYQGRFKLTGDSSPGGATLKVDTTNTTNVFTHTQENFASNLGTNQTAILLIGKSGSSRNSGYLGYLWGSNSSFANKVTLGHYSHDNLFQMDPYGNVSITGVFTEQSSIRYKENISTITGALDKVNSLRGVYYNKIDNPNQQEIGLIAEEVNEVAPQLVLTENDQVEGVKYSKTVALLVEAIKELTARVEELENGKD